MHISTNTKDLQATTVLSGALLEGSTMQHDKNSEYTFFIIIKENRILSHTLWNVHKIFSWLIENKQVQFIWIRMPNYNTRQLNRKEGFVFCPPSQRSSVLFCVLFKLRKKEAGSLPLSWAAAGGFGICTKLLRITKIILKYIMYFERKMISHPLNKTRIICS